jgi:23S rRNA (guanosine2251-2'-O)-methyltransferase
METIYGLHSVEEALRSGTRQFDHVCVARERLTQGDARRLTEIMALSRAAGVPVRTEPREALTQLAGRQPTRE